MADYEILVINEELPNREAKRGEIVIAFPSGYPWKEREKSSRFAIIPYTGTKEDVREILTQGYVYNFDDSKFVSVVTGFDFDSDKIVTVKDAPDQLEGESEKLASLIDPNWKDSEDRACNFLAPSYENIDKESNTAFLPIRLRWANIFKKHIELDGMKEYVATILYRDFGMFAKVGKELPSATKTFIMNSIPELSQDDKDWLKWLWRE